MSELLAEVKAARRAEKALERHTGRIKELLVDVRLADRKLKVADLEAEIDRFYDRATISRITYPALKAADQAATEDTAPVAES